MKELEWYPAMLFTWCSFRHSTIFTQTSECVCVRERVCERESVCEREKERVFVFVCVCVCVCERQRERKRGCASGL